jgi:hypothetical protein
MQIFESFLNSSGSELSDLLLRPGGALVGIADPTLQVAEFTGETGFGPLQRQKLRFSDELLIRQAALALEFLLVKNIPRPV